MTNRPNLSEEEKEHYNKVAMDKILERLNILKKMNTKESKEGVKRFFDNTKQNS